MAERRMFSRKVTESDLFLDMPLSAQALYFHLGMEADDEGFVNSPRKTQRMIGATLDDLKLLIVKGFVIAFKSGVVVITHWRISNYVQKDRFHSTDYESERSLLETTNTGVYRLKDGCIQNVSKMDTDCIQNVSKMDTEVRLGKDRLGKDRLGKDRLGKDRGDKNNTISSERSEIASEPEADVEAIPLNDGTEWRPKEKDYQEYVRLYPAVDVQQEFRSMRSWCNSNPTKRKTRTGVKRFVNAWLSKTQDRGGSRRHSSNTFDMEEYLRGEIINDQTGNT